MNFQLTNPLKTTPIKAILLCFLLLMSITGLGQEKQPGDVIWEFETEGPVTSSPAIGRDGTVYCVSPAKGNQVGKLYAISTNGTKKWEYIMHGTNAYISTPVIGAAGTVHVAAGGWVHAVKPSDGNWQWIGQFGMSSYASSRPAIDGTTLYQGSTGSLEAYKSNSSRKWKLNGGTYGTPLIGPDGIVYINTGEEFYAINNDGTKKNGFKTGNYLSPSFAIWIVDTIYVGSPLSGSSDKRIYALDGQTGAKKWEFETEVSVKTSPAIGNDGTIYCGSQDSVYALNWDGTIKWEFRTGGYIRPSPAIGKDKIIYIGSSDKKIYALDGETGDKKWEFETGAAVHSSAAIGSDGTVYFGSDDKKIYALKSSSTGPADSPWPMLGQNAQRTNKMITPGATPPKLYTNPFGQLATAGMSVSFSILVSGSKPLNYQWYKNGEVIKQATDSTLQFDSVSMGDQGSYSVLVSNQLGESLSKPGELVVVASVITSQPGDTEVDLNEGVKFDIKVDGEGPFSYQWKHNGINIGDPTESPSLSLDKAKLEDSGEYRVSVTNKHGITESDPFTFKVKGWATSFIINDAEVEESEVTSIDSARVQITSNIKPNFPPLNIFYTLDGSEPNFTSTPYRPFTLSEPVTIRAIAYSADFTISAEAKPVSIKFLRTYNLSVNANGGSHTLVPPGGRYVEGTKVTISVKADEGWKFIGWFTGATLDSSNTKLTRTIEISGNEHLKAIFGTDIITNEIGGGKIIQTPPNPVPFGTTVTLEGSPNEDHYFFRWAGDAESAENNLVLPNLNNAGLKITALFAELSSLKLGDKKWWSKDAGSRAAPAIGSDNIIYYNGRGFDIRTGLEKWIYHGYGWIIGTPVVSKSGNLYSSSTFFSDNILVGINPNGEVKWYLNNGRENIGPLAVGHNETIYFGTPVGNFMAIDGQPGTKKWEFKAKGSIKHAPSIGKNGDIYFGDDMRDSHGNPDNSTVYALSENGELRWECEIDNPTINSAAIGTDGTIYIPSWSTLYAFSSAGIKKWEYKKKYKKNFSSAPIIGEDGTVYIGNDHNLFALNGENGATIWQKNISHDVYSTIIANDGIIYIGDFSMLTALDTAMGGNKILWRNNVGGYMPILGDDNMLYSSGNGLSAIKISSSGPADSPWPMYGQNAQRTGRAPAPVPDPIQITIPDKTAWPFTVSFTTAEGSTYVFQASGDLKNWSKVEEVNGTGGEVNVTDLREAIFQKQYYRVKLVE